MYSIIHRRCKAERFTGVGSGFMDEKIMVSVLLEFYGQLLSEKQLEIMNYYYNDDLSLREVADMIGITRQGVHNTLKRSEGFLREFEDKLGLYGKWQEMKAELEVIEECLTDIYNENQNSRKSLYVTNKCGTARKAAADMKNKF